ncbi:MAG TPA: DUF882 domain-containing protein [Caulobacteraceae bacterium]|nr:DUF882 domain-containing protein [Caulobacteraceae bacterium]
MIARRKLIAAGLGLAGGLAAAPAALAALAAPTRRLAFNNLHTGETLDVAYYENGCYVGDALAEVNHVLRDFRTGDVHVIEPRLLDLLTVLAASLETKSAFGVISGYRSPQTNAMLHEQSGQVASGSLHMQGQAIDIRLPGVDSATVRDAALKLAIGGVGYYPTSDFVHVDVGRVRRWQGS